MIAVTEVRYTPAQPRDIERGLLGYVVFQYGQMEVCAVVRRARSGQRYLSYPEREDRHGRRHALVRPVTPEARAAIERAVLAALELSELGGAA